MIGGATLTKLLGTSAWYAPGSSIAYVVDTIVNEVGISKTFSANIGGAIGYPHTYVGNSVHTFVSAATSSIIAGGAYNHKFVRATDGAVIQGGDYNHTFVSAKTGAVKVTGAGNVTPTGATYDGATGLLVITANSHGLTDSNTVGIITDGITFKCTMDGNATDHAYPRRSDPNDLRRHANRDRICSRHYAARCIRHEFSNDGRLFAIYCQ